MSKNKRLTLKDIKEHLEKQDRRTMRVVYLAGTIFGASLVLVGVSQWIGRVSDISFAWNCGFYIVAGFAFMSWCRYKQRKIKD